MLHGYGIKEDIKGNLLHILQTGPSGLWMVMRDGWQPSCDHEEQSCKGQMLRMAGQTQGENPGRAFGIETLHLTLNG